MASRVLRKANAIGYVTEKRLIFGNLDLDFSGT